MIIEFKEYKIGYLCRLFGISPKAIRLYSEKELLKPSNHSENNYRLFCRDDVFTLDYIRRLRKMGFSLNEIHDLFYLDCISESVDSLSGKIAALKSQLQEIELQIAKAEVHRKELQDFISAEHSIELTAPISFITSSIEGSIEETAEKFHRISPDFFPKLTFSFPSADMESFAGMLLPENRQQVSFILMYEDLHNRHEAEDLSRYGVTVLAPCQYVHAIVSADAHADYHFWDAINGFIAEQHLTRTASSFLQYIGTVSAGKAPKDFYHVYVPVQT